MRKSKVSKRLIAVLASLCLVFSSVLPATILSVGAQDEATASVALEVPTEELKPGDTFTAVVKISDLAGNGFGGIQLDIDYDPAVLTAQSLRVSSPTNEYDEGMSVVTNPARNQFPDNSGHIRMMTAFYDGITNSETFTDLAYATVTFQVAEDYGDKDSTEISINDITFGQYQTSGVTGYSPSDFTQSVSLYQPEVVEPAGTVVLSASPASATVGDEVTVSLLGTTNADVNSFQYEFSYDPSKLEYVSATAGEGFSSTTPNVDEENGTIRNMLVGMDNSPALVNGTLNNTVLATYTFKVISTDNTSAAFTWNQGETKMGRFDNDVAVYLPLTCTDGAVTIVDSSIHVESISLNVDSVDLSMDDADSQSATLTVTETPAENTDNLTYTWSTSDDTVATVENGVVTAVGGGQATITVEASNGLKDTATVYVSDLSFDDSDATFTGEVGESVTLAAPVDSGKTSTPLTYTWTTSDDTVATVENGVVTFVGAGEVTITVEASNGVSFSKDYTVDITVPVESISLNVDSVDLSMDDPDSQSVTLTVTETPAGNSEDLTYTWSTSDDDVATVVNGVVTAVGGGQATITVEASNGMKDTAIVYVSDLSFDDSDVNYSGEVGSSVTLTAPQENGASSTPLTYTWTTSNDKVATVENGKVTFVGAGEVTITVEASNGVSFSKDYNVSIIIPSTGIQVGIDHNDLTLNPNGNDEATITVTPVPGDTTDQLTYRFETSDPDVVTVDSTGKVTVVGNGTATITVTASDGTDTYTQTISVNVGDVNADTADLDVELTEGNNTADMNDYFIINGEISDVTWTSDNSDVATVDENGIVTFVGDGEVTITGEYSNGLSYSKTFTVTHDCAANLVHVERVEPTTEAAGNIEYWYCSVCNKYYADAEGTQEINPEDVVLEKLPGEETPSTPSTPGGTTPGGTTSGGDSSTPQTGESNVMLLWSSLAVLALLGLGAGVVVLKKKSSSK